MKFICPLVVVSDIRRSREFYENVLCQAVKADYGENILFEGGFAIHLKEHFKSVTGCTEIKEKSNNFELYFEHDDLDDVVKKIRDLGLEFVHEAVEQPWKQLVVRFYDYDNNMIEIGESMEHVAYRLSKHGYSTEEICRITYLDKETIEKAIREWTIPV